jgi:hypothetical protein
MTAFQYTLNCDLSEYYQGKTVSCVRFPVSRHHKFEKTIHFNRPLTIQQAIRQSELYLSQPITSEFYKNLHRGGPFVRVYPGDCRGKLLGGLKRLEKIEKFENNGIRLQLKS